MHTAKKATDVGTNLLCKPIEIEDELMTLNKLDLKNIDFQIDSDVGSEHEFGLLFSRSHETPTQARN